jgi:AcrR family transcriptional regulator
MEQIAKALKISKLTLYSRFADKEELFTAVITAKCQGQIPEDIFGDVDKQPMEASLYRIAYALMELLTSEGPMKMERMLIGTEFKGREHLSQRYYEAGPERVKNIIADYLNELHTEKKLYVPNPEFSANMFAAMIKGSDICLRAFMQIPPKFSEQEKKDYCHEVVNMFIAAHCVKET